MTIRKAPGAAIKIDAAKVRGKKLKVTSMVRGENVSKPEKPYLGVKAMIYYKAASGDRQWIEHKPKKTARSAGRRS